MADRSDGSRLCCWHAREASALPSPPLCYYLPVGVEAVLCGRIRVTHGEQRLVVPDESKLQGGEAAGHTQQPKSVSRRVVIRELAERCGPARHNLSHTRASQPYFGEVPTECPWPTNHIHG